MNVASKVLVGVVALCAFHAATATAQLPPRSAVEQAKQVAVASRPYWTTLGNATLRAQYSVGWAAAPTAGYALLGAPALTFTLITSGPAGAGMKVSTDGLLKLAELLVGSPREAAQHVAASARNDALAQYREAFPLGKRLLAGEALTEAEAGRFLQSRYGLLRLNAAGVLYAATLNAKTATQRLATTSTRYAVGQLVEAYQLRALGTGSALPIARAGFFIKDLSNIFAKSGEGLWSYQPFLDYVKTLEAIDKRAADEATLSDPNPPGRSPEAATPLFTGAGLPPRDSALPRQIQGVGRSLPLALRVNRRIAGGSGTAGVARLVSYVAPCECDSGEPTATRVGLYVGATASAPARLALERAIHIPGPTEQDVYDTATVSAVAGGWDVELSWFAVRSVKRSGWRGREDIVILPILLDSVFHVGIDGRLLGAEPAVPRQSRLNGASYVHLVGFDTLPEVVRLRVGAAIDAERLPLLRADTDERSQSISISPHGAKYLLGPFSEEFVLTATGQVEIALKGAGYSSQSPRGFFASPMRPSRVVVSGARVGKMPWGGPRTVPIPRAVGLGPVWIQLTPDMGNACGEGCDYPSGWKMHDGLPRILREWPQAKWDIFRGDVNRTNGHDGILYIGPFTSCREAESTILRLKAMPAASGLNISCAQPPRLGG